MKDQTSLIESDISEGYRITENRSLGFILRIYAMLTILCSLNEYVDHICEDPPLEQISKSQELTT